jgi:hypothetical protein
VDDALSHRNDTPIANDLPGLGCTRVRFAGGAEARLILMTPDPWIQTAGSVQRSVLMRQSRPVTVGEFSQWQADAVRVWRAPDELRWRRAWQKIKPNLDQLKIPLPDEVLLISTTGFESENTPHTRSNAIILPVNANAGQFSDAELLAHEFFHVMTRYSPELRDRLYSVIGFEPVNELQWPESWDNLRISDQDAPHLSHAMRVTYHGENIVIMPVAIAVKFNLNMHLQALENLLEVRLLEIDPGIGKNPSTARMRDQRPVWHRIEEIPEYGIHLGNNTDYILHPEETLADNFMFLISQRPVRNPELLNRIDAELRKAVRDVNDPAQSAPCPPNPALQHPH